MDRYKIAILDVWAEAVKEETRKVAPDNFELLFAESADEDHQVALIEQCDFIVCGTAAVTRRMMDAGRHVKLIQKWGVGYDKVDLDLLRERGVALCNTAGSNKTVVAEHTILLILGLYRHLLEIDRRLRDGEWLDIKIKLRNHALQLRGKTIGILGFGNIGRAVARRLKGFEVDVIYHDLVRADAETERELNARAVSFDELLAGSDILTVHVPLDESTRDMVDAAAMAKMKPSATIVNCARGGIVNEMALYEALKEGRLRGAGMDVWDPEPAVKDHPLFALEQVIVTPHAAGSAFDNVGNVSAQCFRNIQTFIKGEPLPESDVVLPASPAIAAAD